MAPTAFADRGFTDPDLVKRDFMQYQDNLLRATYSGIAASGRSLLGHRCPEILRWARSPRSKAGMELRKFCKSFGQHGTVPPPSSALDLLPSRGEHALSRYAPIAIAGTAFLVCTYGSYRVANRRRVVVRKVAAVRKPSKALSKARHRKWIHLGRTQGTKREKIDSFSERSPLLTSPAIFALSPKDSCNTTGRRVPRLLERYHRFVMALPHDSKKETAQNNDHKEEEQPECTTKSEEKENADQERKGTAKNENNNNNNNNNSDDNHEKTRLYNFDPIPWDHVAYPYFAIKP
ncbi:MAG: hypothetical protein LQ346_006293 [Caloplaca aetnensis]|nr:MAG: hypothetical protein LQ346_006293 [Caloplaca aetnensis]